MKQAPHVLQEFFARDITALVVGILSMVAGIFVRHIEQTSRFAEYKEGIGALCDALVIAAILKLFVDPILKREAARENAQDVFRYAFGYTLPDKLKRFVQDLVLESRIVRRNCQLRWHITEKANDPQRVEVNLTVTFFVTNFTNKKLLYRHEVYAWKDNEDDVACVRSMFFEPRGSKNQGYNESNNKGLRPGRDGFIRGKNVLLAPDAPKEHNSFGVVYYAETNRFGIDQFSIREPTLEIDVSLEVDDRLGELDFSVIPDSTSSSKTDEYKAPWRDPSSKKLTAQWKLDKVFVANEKVVLRWKKREPKLTFSPTYNRAD